MDLYVTSEQARSITLICAPFSGFFSLSFTHSSTLSHFHKRHCDSTHTQQIVAIGFFCSGNKWKIKRWFYPSKFQLFVIFSLSLYLSQLLPWFCFSFFIFLGIFFVAALQKKKRIFGFLSSLMIHHIQTHIWFLFIYLWL